MNTFCQDVKTGPKQPSFGVAETNPAKHCTQHVRLQCGVKRYREREVGLHHSGEETIDNVIQSDGVRKQSFILPLCRMVAGPPASEYSIQNFCLRLRNEMLQECRLEL